MGAGVHAARPLAAVSLVAVFLAGCGSRAVQSADAGPALDAPSAADQHLKPDGPSVIVNDVGLADSNLPFKQRVARACVFARSCSAPLSGPDSLPASMCVRWFANRAQPRLIGQSLLDRLLACAPAKDCKAFFACYGGTWVGSTVCRRGGQCDKASNRIIAPGNPGLFLRCDQLGGKCIDLPTRDPRACCALKTCAGTDDTNCHPNPGGGATQGTRCLQGMAYDFDCAPLGQTCSTAQGQLCEGPGASCNPASFKVSCSGTQATYCFGKADGSGNIATVDCAKNPLLSACKGYGSNLDPCIWAGVACDPSYAGECQAGQHLLVCVDGDKVPVDCSTIGFDQCGKLSAMTKEPTCILHP